MPNFKMVNGVLQPLTSAEETEFTNRQAEAAGRAGNESILRQIADLEAQITQRRVREAIRGTDSGYLTSIDNQIAALRAQLT